jgi:cell division protein ZapA (FtsZ GTPase activity inhibitor)
MEIILQIAGILCLISILINSIIMSYDILSRNKKSKQIEKEIEETLTQMRENIEKTEQKVLNELDNK